MTMLDSFIYIYELKNSKKGGKKVDRKLKPVINYTEPEYPAMEGLVAADEADCLGHDVCSVNYSYQQLVGTCWNGMPYFIYQTVYVYNGCSCKDAQCECADAWYDWW